MSSGLNITATKVQSFKLEQFIRSLHYEEQYMNSLKGRMEAVYTFLVYFRPAYYCNYTRVNKGTASFQDGLPHIDYKCQSTFSVSHSLVVTLTAVSESVNAR